MPSIIKWFASGLAKTSGALVDFQRILSHGQRYPIVGVAPSFVKIVVCAVQIPVVVASFLFLPVACMSGDNTTIDDTACAAWGGFLACGVSLGYAISNICTLSLAGFLIEGVLSCGKEIATTIIK